MLKYVQCDHTAHYSIIYWNIPTINYLIELHFPFYHYYITTLSLMIKEMYYVQKNMY
jgi:hypothetical protein